MELTLMHEPSLLAGLVVGCCLGASLGTMRAAARVGCGAWLAATPLATAAAISALYVSAMLYEDRLRPLDGWSVSVSFVLSTLAGVALTSALFRRIEGYARSRPRRPFEEGMVNDSVRAGALAAESDGGRSSGGRG